MDDTRDADLNRRDLLKLGAAAAIAASVAGPDRLSALSAAVEQGTAARTFFTSTELTLVDELAEMIIPADEHSPGARAARVAA
jgi:hypothetical protein